jgi:acetyl esterase/lipase
MAHLTRQEVLASGTVSPTYKTAFETRPLEIGGTDISGWRSSRAEHLRKLRHLYPIPGPIPNLVTETLHDVSTRDGASIIVKVYQPCAGPPEGKSSPLIMMYHEGGWMMGDLTDEDLNCRMFARDLGAVCVNVEYR